MKVLIVDDEKYLVEALGDILIKKGFTVDTAYNGLEALEKLREKSFDFMIMDLKMPRMGGEKLMKITREKYPQTEIIIITGYGTIKNAVTATKNGARDYLVKPFSPEELLLSMSKTLQK